MIWQMMVALLHLNMQPRSERDGDTEIGCQEPALQQKTTDDDVFNAAAAHTQAGQWSQCGSSNGQTVDE